MHQLVWPALQLQLTADRLYEDHSFAVHAEIAVRSTAPGDRGLVHRARENLTSTTTRRTLWKHLSEISTRITPEMWRVIIEQAWYMIIDGHRQGDPPTPLSEVPLRTDALRYRIFPLLSEGDPNLLYGAPDTAKSMLAVYLAVLMTLPLHHGGLEVEPGAVLYLDYEAKPTDIKERATAIAEGLGYPSNEALFIYRRCYRPLASEITEIQRWVLQYHIELVIIDSAVIAVGGDPVDIASTNAYFAALRSLGVTTLTIGHQPKDEKNATPYGNQMWKGFPRKIWHTLAQHELESDTLQVGLYDYKRNNSRQMRPLGFRLRFVEGTTETDRGELGARLHAVHISRFDVREAGELARELPLRERLQQVLVKGAMEEQEIADALGANIAQVRARLYEGKDRFIRVAKGTWGLREA